MTLMFLLVVPLLVIALFGLSIRPQIAATRDAHPDLTDYDARYRADLGGAQ